MSIYSRLPAGRLRGKWVKDTNSDLQELPAMAEDRQRQGRTETEAPRMLRAQRTVACSLVAGGSQAYPGDRRALEHDQQRQERL